ncbi:MAG: hypothetical protein ACRDZ8_17645 [Acidimicrobiales bacterium]
MENLMHDISDAQLGRIIVSGSIVGMAVLFAAVVVIALLAGVSPGEAVGIAIIPTVFGGWFYGGTLYLMRAAYGDEKKGARPPALPSVPAEAQPARALDHAA